MNDTDRAMHFLRDGFEGNPDCTRYPWLDRALSEDARRCPGMLYRGLMPCEVVDQGGIFQSHGYLLLTENVRVAMAQADASDTTHVLELKQAVALEYAPWLDRSRNRLLSMGATVDDLDARISRARNQGEWIMAPRTMLSVERNARGSGTLAGHEVVSATMSDQGNTVREVLDGVRAEERMAGDPPQGLSMLLSPDMSDPMLRLDSLMERRRTAALCSQPRLAQRLDLRVNLLRAALGMQPLPPIDVIQSGRAFDQNREVLREATRDPWNRAWMRQQTTAGVERWSSSLRDRGFRISRRTVDADTVAWVATGSERGGLRTTYELHVLGGAWCTSATRNGGSLGLFDDAPGDNGALQSLASDQWNGMLTGPQAQQYCTSWKRLADATRSAS